MSIIQSVIICHYRTFCFRDLTCDEVEGGWMFILSLSMILNILGCIFTLMYLCLVMCFRNSPERYYTSVQTNMNVR